MPNTNFKDLQKHRPTQLTTTDLKTEANIKCHYQTLMKRFDEGFSLTLENMFQTDHVLVQVYVCLGHIRLTKATARRLLIVQLIAKKRLLNRQMFENLSCTVKNTMESENNLSINRKVSTQLLEYLWRGKAKEKKE